MRADEVSAFDGRRDRQRAADDHIYGILSWGVSSRWLLNLDGLAKEQND
jgi:hypothetical protein